MGNPLQRLSTFGQSFWLDNLSRTIIASGELECLIRDDGLCGITSNPTIFEKALASTDQYDHEIEQLAIQGRSAEQIFEALAIHDIRRAADLLRPVYKATNGDDGYVSLELPPALALNTERSITEARRLFDAVGRQNVMIKVPGTEQGLPAIEQLIADGVNVNVTLLFSLQNYELVAEAYLRGLERRAERGESLRSVASVASFFVSRVDTEVDRRLDERMVGETDAKQRKQLEALKGTVAIANAKLAYQRFTAIFLESERFQRLAREQGARLQRPLWASTSTKNPAYSDVLYIETLIGPYTVQTMAPASVEAFRDHGTVARTVDTDVDAAQRTLARLQEIGISYDEVTDLLQKQGVDAFASSFDNLIAGIEAKRAELLRSRDKRGGWFGDAEPQVRAELDRLGQRDVVGRLWQRDPSLWSADAAVQQKVANRLGWLTVHEQMAKQVGRLRELADDVRSAGFRTAVLLGMGGSSLAPEVFQTTLGNQDDFPELIVLDTTNPRSIAKLSDALDLDRTIFIVSSKSGTTVETSTLYQHFYHLMSERKGANAGAHFVAVTDPGTALERLARERGFRHIFTNPADIGGRYSALSFFGLVPAAMIGLDVPVLLERAAEMAARLQAPGQDNPALWLGAALGILSTLGRDKVTFVPDPAVASLADWLEQLIAESTGKDGTGIIPIAHEPHGALNSYGSDRVFVGFDLVPQPHSETDAMLAALQRMGHPVIRIQLRDEWDIAAEFLRWEVATAIAGVVLRINPFDEPNVQESKDNTNRLLEEFARRQELPEPLPTTAEHGVGAFGNDAPTIQEALVGFLNRVRLGDYVSIMAFADRTPETHLRLQELRRLIRDHLNVATTLGYGPRFLHSIGQLYKGGPASGAFLQIVVIPGIDVPIPEEPYSFDTLYRAQALGDFEALQQRGRPLLRLTISEDAVHGLERALQSMVIAALR